MLLERAVGLDPNAAWGLSRLGWLEVYSGRPAAAHPHFERALRLSPLDPMNFNNHAGIASAFQVAGEPSRAADEFLRALHERPNALWIHRNLAPALLAAGREEEPKASRDALIAAYPGFTVARFKAAMVFDPEALERIAAGLLERHTEIVSRTAAQQAPQSRTIRLVVAPPVCPRLAFQRQRPGH